MNKINVLIIDDNIDDQELCARSLGTDRYTVQCIKDSNEGFDIIAKNAPDVILLDYSLPGNNGLKVLKKIKSDSPNIPVIILTGQGNESIAVMSLKEGAYDYIKKSSITSESLIDVIDQAIEASVDKAIDVTSPLVMVVDDNLDDQEKCVRSLKKVENKDYNYICIADGKKVVDAITERVPDVILLDYSLPGYTGLDLISKIHEKNQYIPVIMMTGQGNESVAVKALKAGACDYIIKGDITPELLDKSIASAIEHNILEKQIYEQDIKIQRQQKELKESQYFLNLMMENNPDIIFVKDRDYKIIQANSAFKNIYPKEMQDKIIGYTTIEEYNLKEAEEFLAMDKKAFSDGYSEAFENITFPDGVNRTLFTQKVRFENNDGQPFILCVGRDITEKEKLLSDLAASNELNSSIMNSSKHMIIATDTKGVVTSFNYAAELALGYKAEEVVGKKTPALWHDQSEVVERAKELSEELGEAIEPGFEVFVIKSRKFGPNTNEWTFVRKDGTTFPVGLTVSCLKKQKDDIIGYVGIIEDISERKKIEIERKKLIEQLTRSNEELERFAYIASHDLQEPLRMVVNFTELLEREYGEGLEGQAIEYLDFASKAAIRMQALVEDLLEYSRVGQEAEKLVEVDCIGVLEDARINLSDSINQYNAVITYDKLPIIKANPIRMTRLFQNIIGNAIKYTDDSKNPKIHVSVIDNKDHWQFSVEDNGIGMKQEYLEKIFVAFKRLHSHADYQGTGIGLSVCKKIIENVGGSIWVESEIGKGSKFLFTIPK